ncbi:MAG: uncharacterized membrane protein YbhN (UPF0104 family) [Polaribacter sp.]|jgi:uncharacterized membrane protein YbhN (UPF0104 family)
MQKSSSHKTKHFLALIIKLFIVIGCGYFMYTKLTLNNQLSFSNFYSNSTKTTLFSIKNILFLLLFSLLNWFFEITKWKILVSFCEKIDFKRATIQSLASLTVSLLTPNRIGEYGAKAIYFEKPLRKQILVLNLVGNLFQLLTTLLFGLAGITFFLLNFNINISIKSTILVLGFSFTLILFAWVLYKKGVSIKGHSLKSLFNFIAKIPSSLTTKIGLYSGIRYLIFSHQFYFLLLLFNVDIIYSEALFSIFSMYFLASIIPMLSIFDIVIKGSIAIWVFSFFNCNEISILSVVLIMWVFNFVLPSIVGSYFVLTFNTDKLIATKE